MRKWKNDHSGEVLNGWWLVQRVDMEDAAGSAAWYEICCETCGKTFIRRYSDIRGKKPCQHGIQHHRGQRCIYMAVTSDMYELPVAVADSVQELAQITGTSARRIEFAVTPSGQRRYSQQRPQKGGLRYYRVPLERSENEAALQA